MSVPVLHETDVDELDLPGRRLRWVVSKDAIAAKHCSACVIRVPPGERCRPAHSHPNGEEIIYIITGTGRTPYASVIEALGMKPGESIFGANLTAAYERLSHLPWVASVDVQRRYPDAIFVTIVEKRPFALWQLPPDANGQSRIAVVERSGAVITTEGVEKFARLPKLVGPGAPSEGAAEGRLGVLEFLHRIGIGQDIGR